LTNDNSISTLIVSVALFASVSIAGNISGGCINPAIGFAQNFVRLIIFGNVDECKFLWVYIVGPSLGGLLAAYVYRNFFTVYFNSNNESKAINAF
jgi:glycerol uptake facilitator-like aquaporin